MSISIICLLIGAYLPVWSATQVSTAQIGNIQLSAHDGDWEFGENAVHIIQAQVPQLSKSLGIHKPVYVHVIIAHTENDFKQMTGGSIPDWGIAAAEAQQGIIFLKSPRNYETENDFRAIVIHELSHVVLGNAVEGESIPRWFDEGLALYNSGELGMESTLLLSRSLFGGQVLSLDEIDDVLTFHQEKASLAYRESLSAIEYLIENYGPEVIARLTTALSDGKSMEQSIMEVTGVSISSFENAWMDYIRKKYLWMAAFDMRFIISLLFVCLFLIAWARKKHQVKKQKIIWEKEEYDEAIDS